MTGSNIVQDNPWPEDAVATLIRLWGDGDSAAQIGRAMGKTRNAVIGKVHRLGLTRSDGAKRQIVPRTTKQTAHKRSGFNPSIPRRKRPLVMVEKHDVVTFPPLNGEGVTLFDLKRDQCHAVILNPPRGSEVLPRYCGNETYGGTAYCEGHFHEYHRPNLKAG